MINFDFLESDSEKVEFINSIGNLIQNGEIAPEKLNECLGNYFAITRYILTLYESVSLEDDILKLEYKMWWSEKYSQSNAILSEGMPASKTISDTKIENHLIVNNSEEYKNWQNKLIMSEKRKSFYYRIMESWKANSKQITELSQNARTELMSLATEKKANEDLTKEGLIRHAKIKKVKLED